MVYLLSPEFKPQPLQKEYGQYIYPDGAKTIVAKTFGEGLIQPQVNHKGRDIEESYKPLIDVLLKANCPPELIEQILIKDGQAWNPALVKKNFDPWNSTRQAFQGVMETTIGPILESGQYSLNQEFADGYNDHRLRHIRWVATQLVKCLSQAGCSEKEIELGEKAVYAHDTFNILSRKMHQHGAIDFLVFLFPRFWENPELLAEVSVAMHLHTESVAQKVFEVIGAEAQTDQDFFARLLQQVGPIPLAMIISDKIHVGADRVDNGMKITPDAFRKDKHFALNAVAQTTSFDVVGNGSHKPLAANWKINFSPLHALSINHEVWKSIQRAQDHQALPTTLEKWLQMFWETYYERIDLVVKSTFALYPTVKEFNIVITDSSRLNLDKDAPQVVRKISRYSVEQDLQANKQGFYTAAA